MAPSHTYALSHFPWLLHHLDQHVSCTLVLGSVTGTITNFLWYLLTSTSPNVKLTLFMQAAARLL